MRSLIVLFISICLAGAVFADAPNGLAFLKISTDVRSGAMGETGVAAGGASAASFYNPALSAFADKNGISFSHHRWIQDINLNFIEAHFQTKVNVGVSLLATGVDDIEVRRTPSPTPAAYVDSRDLAFTLNLSQALSKKWGAGVNVRYISEKIYYSSTHGWALDFGTVYKLTEEIRLGAAFSNLGSMSEMESEKPDLPWTARAGAAWDLALSGAGAATIAAELHYVNDEEARAGLGFEYRPMEIIALRGGYLINYDERGLTAGLGLSWKNVGLDFAYLPFDSDLGNSSRFSLRLDF